MNRTLHRGTVIERFDGVVLSVDEDHSVFTATLKDDEGLEYTAEIWVRCIPGRERVHLRDGRMFVWEIVLGVGCEPKNRFTFLLPEN